MTRIDADAIVDAAVRGSDVSHPDLEPFRSNLDLLVGCLDAEAGLTPDGIAATQRLLAVPLRNRIEVSAWLHAHPEIEEEPIDRPVFLTGLPRSGTTYFQYLFDPEPSLRMLRHWEGRRPCPPPGFDPDSARHRLEASRRDADANRRHPLRSEIAKIHLTDVDGPEECVAIIDQTFANVGHYWTYRVPTYFARCLDAVDLGASYAHHRRVVQLLQWKAERKRWVLKWPCHLIALDAIVDTYPDASFVVTHRDPVQALASNCSLATLLRTATADHVDRHELGRQMKEMILVHLQRLVEFDERMSGSGRVVHVDYRSVVERPEHVMPEVFASLGMEMTPRVRDAIAAWRADNPPGKRGTHTYDLGDYGLDRRQVADELAFYTDRFDVPTDAGNGQ